MGKYILFPKLFSRRDNVPALSLSLATTLHLAIALEIACYFVTSKHEMKCANNCRRRLKACPCVDIYTALRLQRQHVYCASRPNQSPSHPRSWACINTVQILFRMDKTALLTTKLHSIRLIRISPSHLVIIRLYRRVQHLLSSLRKTRKVRNEERCDRIFRMVLFLFYFLAIFLSESVFWKVIQGWR